MSVAVDTAPVEARRQAIRSQAEAILYEARAQGRESLTPAENANYTRLLNEANALSEDLERRAQINDRLARIPRPTGGAHVGTDHALTYRRHGRESWFRDMAMLQTGRDDGDARRRLAQHGDDVATNPGYTEYRDLSRTDGQGGYGVPPAWLMDQYVELARPGRAFADLVTRQPLPGGTDVLSIPKLLTGTAVAIQTADNTAIAEVDASDTVVNAPVRTIAGQESLSLQLLEQSPINFDEVLFRDLIAAYGSALDVQVIAGTGTNGQMLGVRNTAGITTIATGGQDIVATYKALANAVQTIHTTRFLPPDVVVCHPRRWGSLLSTLDTTNRPLFVPNAQGPMNAAGLQTAVASQQIVGSVMGLPVVTDPNLPTNLGYGTNQDSIFVLRSQDLILFEGGVRARILFEPKADTLTVVCQVWGYCAFTAGRFPQSVVEITGFTPPSW